jgi:hypothetical protein
MQYFAMFLFSTSIVLRSALLQSLDQILGEIADHKLRHRIANLPPVLAMLALAPMGASPPQSMHQIVYVYDLVHT